jgi:hypothetical protein
MSTWKTIWRLKIGLTQDNYDLIEKVEYFKELQVNEH